MEKARWTTNLRRVEVEIHTGCNLSCPNCDRSSAQAPSQEGMSVEQISRFVRESVELSWDWERITILGGEPTLHPDLDTVIEVLGEYHAVSPSTSFRIYSNGYGSVVNRRLARIPRWIDVFNTGKTRQPPTFSAYNLAPADFRELEHDDFTKGCAITSWCGLGLTRYGYYPCGAGASIDRIFGFDIGIKTLALITPQAVLDQLRQLCRMCGHYRDFDDRVEYSRRNDPTRPASWVREARVSPTWASAYAAYGRQPAKLSLY